MERSVQQRGYTERERIDREDGGGYAAIWRSATKCVPATYSWFEIKLDFQQVAPLTIVTFPLIFNGFKITGTAVFSTYTTGRRFSFAEACLMMWVATSLAVKQRLTSLFTSGGTIRSEEEERKARPRPRASSLACLVRRKIVAWLRDEPGLEKNLLHRMNWINSHYRMQRM